MSQVYYRHLYPIGFTYDAVAHRTIRCQFNEFDQIIPVIQNGKVVEEDGTDFGINVVHQLAQRIYCFKAERFNIGRHGFGDNRVLDNQARNLPEVLNHLRSYNFSRYERFMENVRQVFPQIKDIPVHPVGIDLEIGIWQYDRETERSDLAIPLQECGTGIGQVLAIFYVVITSEFPQVIIIDEPQTFLHPGAVRKLIEILRTVYPQHQYVISTHSAEILTAAEPNTVIIIKHKDAVSDFQIIDRQKNQELRSFFTEVGIKQSDVFGMDRILWVEGETEEICFPLILEKLARRSLKGTVIKRVKHTSEFVPKRIKQIVDLYLHLSQGNSLLPPALSFLLDDENRTDKDKIREELRLIDAEGRLRFLTRRTYENYLLNPRAIAATINSIEGCRSSLLKEEEVTAQLEAKRGSEPYDAWIIRANAPNILQELFSDLTDTKEEYIKTKHSPQLTAWMIENAPIELNEIKELLCSIFGSSIH